MTLELNGRQVVVTGERRELARTSADSLSLQRADVVIWIREWKGDVNELKRLMAKIETQVASQPPN
jgi:NAD(P)-dependent dehydrogenase (short-subunit alcohol dehydrogenase family)